jgi:hypothetical protein
MYKDALLMIIWYFNNASDSIKNRVNAVRKWLHSWLRTRARQVTHVDYHRRRRVESVCIRMNMKRENKGDE